MNVLDRKYIEKFWTLIVWEQFWMTQRRKKVTEISTFIPFLQLQRSVHLAK